MEIQVTNQSIVLAQEIVNQIIQFEEEKTRIKLFEDDLRKALLKAMEDNGIKSYTSPNNELTITYKDGYVSKRVDTDALKEQGLYDSFLKESKVKPSVVIKVNDND